MSYLFSVVIPVYNSEDFIESTIESILGQNYSDVEIIIVDDCSNDKTLQICKNYQRLNNNIKIINKKNNSGVGDSRNEGINKASGDYIIFVDSDDELYKNALKNLYNEVRKRNYPEVLVVHYKKDTFPQSNYKLIQDNINNTNCAEKLIKYLNKHKFPFADCWSFVVKKSFITDNMIYFPKIRIGESELFVAKLICYMKSFSFMPQEFYNKKDRDFSLNHTQGFEAANSTLVLLIEFYIFNTSANFNEIKNNFNNSYIQDAFGIFSSLLILLNKNELKKLSYIIEKDKHNLNSLIKLPENINFYSLVMELGGYKGLLKYRETIVSNKIKLVKNLSNNYLNIYAYCRHKYTAATIKALNENGYNVSGVIDDGKEYINTNFLGFKTINSQIFFDEIKGNIRDVLVVITHQRDKTLNKISDNLIKNGINKKQIVKIKY